MRCARARKLVSRRLDGPLPGPDLARLDVHLTACDRCRVAAEQIELAWRSLGALETVPPEPDGWAAIAAAAGAARPGLVAPLAGWRFGPSLAVASSLVVLAAAVGATGALLVARGIETPPATLEVRLLGETTGLLAWDSPAARLAHGIDARMSSEERR